MARCPFCLDPDDDGPVCSCRSHPATAVAVPTAEPTPVRWLPGPARGVEPFFESGVPYLVAVAAVGVARPQWDFSVITFNRWKPYQPAAGEFWTRREEDIAWYIPLDQLPEPEA